MRSRQRTNYGNRSPRQESTSVDNADITEQGIVPRDGQKC